MIGFLFRFSQNIASYPRYVDIYPASLIPKRLHRLVEPVFRPMSESPIMGSRADIKEQGYRVPTEPGAVTSMLQWVSDAEVHFIPSLSMVFPLPWEFND